MPAITTVVRQTYNVPPAPGGNTPPGMIRINCSETSSGIVLRAITPFGTNAVEISVDDAEALSEMLTQTIAAFRSKTAPSDLASGTAIEKAVAEFKANLSAQGKTIGQWADERGFDRLTVYRTLAGTLKGNFGKSHEVLVAAGIKSTTPDSLAA